MTRLFEAKPFLIAEVGSNWQTLDHCLESIRVAKECGADAVKFQAFNSTALYGFYETYNGMEVVEDSELKLNWLPTIKAECDRVGIEFMCTAFSPELVKAVDPFVSVHKVASSDAAWPQMLDAVGWTMKPVLISTGAKTAEDKVRIGDRLKQRNIQGVPMICVAAYPADYVEMKSGPGHVWGLSDHSLGYTVPVIAAQLGAIVIEKHFTTELDCKTPDAEHSLRPHQFKRMVDIIRGREVESEETAMFLRHNRRLITTRDVAAGNILTYGENFGAYRSLEDDTRGASPFDWELLQGKRAKVAVARGTGIGLGDVE